MIAPCSRIRRKATKWLCSRVVHGRKSCAKDRVVLIIILHIATLLFKTVYASMLLNRVQTSNKCIFYWNVFCTGSGISYLDM